MAGARTRLARASVIALSLSVLPGCSELERTLEAIAIAYFVVAITVLALLALFELLAISYVIIGARRRQARTAFAGVVLAGIALVAQGMLALGPWRPARSTVTDWLTALLVVPFVTLVAGIVVCVRVDDGGRREP